MEHRRSSRTDKFVSSVYRFSLNTSCWCLHTVGFKYGFNGACFSFLKITHLVWFFFLLMMKNNFHWLENYPSLMIHHSIQMLAHVSSLSFKQLLCDQAESLCHIFGGISLDQKMSLCLWLGDKSQRVCVRVCVCVKNYLSFSLKYELSNCRKCLSLCFLSISLQFSQKIIHSKHTAS